MRRGLGRPGRVSDLGDAEVDQERMLAVRAPDQQDVLGLQIAMEHSLGVGVADGLADLAQEARRERSVERSGGERVAQRPSFVKREDQEEASVLDLAGVDQTHDAGMIQSREHARLLAKAPAHPVLRGPEIVQQLDDDAAAGDLFVAGLEDHARAAPSQHALQAIPPADAAAHPGVLPLRTAALQEIAGPAVPGEELGQIGIARGGDGGLWIGRFERLRQSLRELIPTPRVHADFPRSCPYSHARAASQSRLTVAGETSRHCAISSFDMPPKYRSSTTRAARG